MTSEMPNICNNLSENPLRSWYSGSLVFFLWLSWEIKKPDIKMQETQSTKDKKDWLSVPVFPFTSWVPSDK